MKNNSHLIYKFLLGLLFGLGLIVSGMVYPQKVIGFLNIFEVWDPSLVFVVLGGILVYATFYFLHLGKNITLLGYEKSLPKVRIIDRKLILGATMFGVGWGLFGYCPAPAIVGAGMLQPLAFVFFVSMLAGMYAFKSGILKF